MDHSTEELPIVGEPEEEPGPPVEHNGQPVTVGRDTASDSLSRALDPRRAIVLLALLGLTDGDIATAVGATDRSVRRWRAGDENRNSLRYWKQIDDLRAVVALLQEEGTLPDENIVHWLRARNRRLRDRRPLDLLADGHFDAVRDAALVLIEG
jgi:hypothetical protein